MEAELDDLVSVANSLSEKDFILVTADLVPPDHFRHLDLNLELSRVK